ncbi:MAG: aspartate--tRNA ligase [Cyclobacteriaceae bacterium]|nr:MAG: aspartate--tRNA ligase [Cyclobacteriaceae bacterium]
MFRTHNCGELRLEDAGKEATLSGWVQKVRDKGGMIWVDLRDRHGITQLIFEEGKTEKPLLDLVKKLGREYVVTATGQVVERIAKNDNIPTGQIEVAVGNLKVLNASKVPPFIIENETDGGEDLRMKYRYLDLRRNPVQESLILRHRINRATREYLDNQGFIEIETPILIKSTPEGARDFIVPSRMNPGEFYALPQSPQTFKQLLMVSGFDRYYQIVKCFRDEDLRADRQPEFTQIDCEMSFVDRDQVLETFEGLTKHLFSQVLNVELGPFPIMDYQQAMARYGSDKPDIRFEMQINDITSPAQGKGFNVFDQSESVLGIVVPGGSEYSRKQIDALTDWVRRPQIGAKGMVYVKCLADGSFKSSVDKFYTVEDLKSWSENCRAKTGDLILVLSGPKESTRKAIGELRLEMGRRLGLLNPQEYKPLWVVDFPLLEWDEDTARFHAMHHPFTSPNEGDIALLEDQPEAAKANAYDLVINGVEIGGGSIRIHDRAMQQRMFKLLGFTEEEAKSQFGFLMQAFEYGAPPHGGIAFGFDRLCALMGGSDSIRDYIAFPKNNAGRDVMIDSPSKISEEQLQELGIRTEGLKD